MTTASQAIEEKLVEMKESMGATLAVSFVGRALLIMRKMKGRNGVLKAGIGTSEFVNTDTAITIH